MKKTVSLGFVLMLLSIAIIVWFIRPAAAQGTIYIRSDGSVDPPDAPISSVDNITYNFTGNINDEIVVERDKIVVDGMGYTLEGPGVSDTRGIELSGRSNVTIRNIEIKAFYTGIYLSNSSNNIIQESLLYCYEWGIYLTNSSCNTISENTIAGNEYGILLCWDSNNNNICGNNIINNWWHGIDLDDSSNNAISGNKITNSGRGIWLGYGSSSTNVSGNTIKSNRYGIELWYSSNNIIYHNNFVDNTEQAHIVLSPSNVWNNDVEGNYWSNYTGVDSDHDGIGDTPHVLGPNNEDNYPLMGMFYNFNATWEEQNYNVNIISNSTISDLVVGTMLSNDPTYNGTKAIGFNATGQDRTVGFCRVCIPKALLNGNYKVFIKTGMQCTEIPFTLLNCSNATHSYLYFTYEHPTKQIQIIPEFPTWTSILTILIALTVATAIYKRRLLKTPIH